MKSRVARRGRVEFVVTLAFLTGTFAGARAAVGQVGGAASAQASGDVAAVTAVIEAVFGAAERRDLAALDTLYAGDDLTVIEGAGIDRGWANYRDHHLKPELERFETLVYRPHEIEARVAGDVAWAIFRYDIQVTMGDRSIDNEGRGTAILEKRGGRWLVRHMQTSSQPRRRE